MERQVVQPSPSGRGLSAVAALLAATLAVLFLASPSHARVSAWVIHKLYLSACAALVVAAATAGGARLLRVARLAPDSLAARVAFGAGVGLGLLSLLTLLLGLFGLLSQIIFVLLIGAVALLCHRTLVALMAEGLARWRRNWGDLSGFECLLLATILLAACMNFMGSLAPPWQYDDLEYHLACPAQFWREGRISFLEHNVYSNFPATVEMWHLTGMALTKSALQGACVGRLIQLSLGLLTALALWSLANRLFGRPAGSYAAAFFYVSPTVASLSYLAHVEIALTFYVVLCLYGFVLYQKSGERGRLILSAIACGLALGCKYTAAAFLMAPLLVMVVTCEMTGRRGIASAARRAGLVLGIALLAASPWLLKNLIYTGNPVYPLAWKVFGGRGWDATKEAMWREAHFAKGFSLSAGVQSARYFFLDSEILIPILSFVFIPLLLRRREGRSSSLFLLGYFAMACVPWFCFSHRDARFLAPFAAGLPVLSAGGLMGVRRSLAPVLVTPLLLLCLAEADLKATKGGNYDAIFCLGADEQFFVDHSDFAAGYGASMFLNGEQVPRDAKVLFVGEARTFYCERECIAPVVFNDNVFEQLLAESPTPAALCSALQQMGVTHLLVNWAEIGRLHETYRGAFDRFDRSKFEAFQRGFLSEVFTAQSPGSMIAVYAVRRDGTPAAP